MNGMGWKFDEWIIANWAFFLLKFGKNAQKTNNDWAISKNPKKIK
jgi:hypothetical protein